MGLVVKAVFRAVRRFRKQDDGTASVEALFWIPAFLAVFALMVDVTLIHHYEARIQRVVQDANRNFSITRLDNENQVETAIRDRLKSINVTDADVKITIFRDSTNTRNNMIMTNVTVPAKHLRMVGLYGAIFNSDVIVTGMHISETAEWDFFDSMTAVPTT